MEDKDRVGQFMFETYPESMGNIYERIQKMGLSYVRSPLHDKDWKEDTGEIKKAHYHNMVIFSGLKSVKIVKEICKELGIKHFVIPYDKRASLRYFCHLDEDPEKKARYDIEDVFVYGDFDYTSVLSAKDGKPSCHSILLKWARDKEFTCFRQFVDQVVDELPNYLESIVDKAYFYNSYLAFNARDQTGKNA